MSLKSVKKNYTQLLKAFSEAGVKLNESQKESLDNFVKDFENTLTHERKVVEEKMENEYKQIMESILKHQEEHTNLSEKIQTKVQELKESEKVAEVVDSFLTEYVEEILPKKTLVDYEKMQKLERIQESLKEMFLISESEIEGKIQEKQEELCKKSEELTEKISVCEDQIAKKDAEISQLKAEKFINEKTKDLPIAESQKILAKVKGMGFAELTEKYQTILESVQQELADEKVVKEDDEKSLEEAITEILEKKDEETASTENNSDKDAGRKETDPKDAEQESDLIGEDDSTVITESLMQSWIDTLNRITPKK